MKFDAKKAQHDYVTDNSMTYRSIAEKYNVNTSTVTKYAKKGEWIKKREQYQTEVTQKAINKSKEKDVDKLSKLATATDNAIDIVSEYISEYNNNTDELNPKSFKDVVSILKDLVFLQRNLNGIKTQQEIDNFELALKKLEIEKEKAGFDEDDDNETGIVFIPAVSDDSNNYVIQEGESNA